MSLTGMDQNSAPRKLDRLVPAQNSGWNYDLYAIDCSCMQVCFFTRAVSTVPQLRSKLHGWWLPAAGGVTGPLHCLVQVYGGVPVDSQQMLWKSRRKISTSQTVSEVQSKTRRQESEASVQMCSNWFCVSTSTTTQTCGHFHHFSEWSSVVEEDYISAQTQASITPPSKTHGPMKNAPE